METKTMTKPISMIGETGGRVSELSVVLLSPITRQT